MNMFLQLAHTKLEVFKSSRELALNCYLLTKEFPAEERFNMIQQIRRAALSVHLNIAEGASRKTVADRKRFYIMARGSLIEIDTAFDLAVNLEYVTEDNLKSLGKNIVQTFKLLSGMIKD